MVLLSCSRLRSPERPKPGTPKGTPPKEFSEAENREAKLIFAGQCGWCHGSFGMTAGTGPRLAGTQMTKQQVEERIRNGKQGLMPSFRKFLDDEQIALMARYIKSLKQKE